MQELYSALLKRLDAEDRQGCLELALAWQYEGRIDIVNLYQQVLTPALRENTSHLTGKAVSIWEEHVRSSIVRTVVECCYPYVIKERDARCAGSSKGKVIIFCPIEEYHEIGARMAMDFFILCGFDALFVGANTPRQDILLTIQTVKPVCVAVSISNYYNLVAAKRTLDDIRKLRDRHGLNFKIAVGGVAFADHPGRYQEIGADLLLQTYEDVHKFAQDYK